MKKLFSNKWFRKALKFAGIIIAIYLLLIIAKFAYIATRPDGPAFDDSDMLPQRPKISAKQNGFDALMTVAGEDEKLSEKYFSDLEEIRTNRNFDVGAEKMELLKSKYGERYALMRNALEYPYIVAPPKDYSDHSINVAYRSEITSLKVMPAYAITLACQEARAGNQSRALEDIKFALQLGRALQNSQGDLIFLLVGGISQETAFAGINAMLDSGVLSESAIPELIKMLDDYAPHPEYWEQSVKFLYESSKNYMGWEMSQNAGFLARTRSRLETKPNTFFKVYYDEHKFMAGQARISLRDADMKHWQRPYKITHGIRGYFADFKNPSRSMAEILMAIAMPNYYRSFEQFVLFRTKYEMMRTKLALLEYRANTGRLPDSLAAVSPQYLKSVPIDPMDGKPIRYDAKKGIIWSVGFDFEDNAGNAGHRIFDKGTDFKSLKKEKDLVLDLRADVSRLN